MESRSLKPPRQFMVKTKKLDGQADRQTRAFVAMKNRKISRKNGIEKKRGIPLMDISSNENEVLNYQEQSKIEKDPKSTKHVDPIKEALRKWQKDKRLREIHEKKTKKAPFRISHVNHQASEYAHSFQNDANEMNSSNMKQRDVTKEKVIPPLRATRENTAAAKKAKLPGPGRENKTGMNGNKPSTRSSRTMKTRSMARKTSAVAATSSLPPPVPMETDDIPVSQTSCPQALPGRVTRSRAENGNEEDQSTSAVIPSDFSFNVPAGVASFAFSRDRFQFKPLSPNSAKKFFPTRSSVLAELPNETERTCLAESKGDNEKNGALEEHEIHDFDSKDFAQEMKGKETANEHVLDATYFRNVANSEIDRLKSRCALWESELGEQEEMIPEEVKGMIRTVIGQVQLLVTKKFKQFSGLLELSENPTAEKKALVSDLQGFWDMMYIQVEDIDKKFVELEQLKENNWQEKKVEVEKKNIKRTTKAKKTSKTDNPKISEKRNKFREIRAQMKAKLQAEKHEDQDAFQIILTPMKNKKADADPSEPEIILTPVRRSTRKSRGCANLLIPLVNLPNVSVDLFGACKSPEAVEANGCLSNLDDSIFRNHSTPDAQFSNSDDLMLFSPSMSASRV